MTPWWAGKSEPAWWQRRHGLRPAPGQQLPQRPTWRQQRKMRRNYSDDSRLRLGISTGEFGDLTVRPIDPDLAWGLMATGPARDTISRKRVAAALERLAAQGYLEKVILPQRRDGGPTYGYRLPRHRGQRRSVR
jgi:hypothetical protein